MTDADPVRAFIEKTIAENPVALFMKGVPDAPQCGFSAMVVQVLDHLGVDFVGVNVLQDPALRDGIKAFTDWPTIPQLYVKGEFIGGADIVKEMFAAGELKTLLAEQGLLAA
jgi:monothiol glutaredoxin